LLRGDLVEVISGINDIPGVDTIGMTTNGLTLTHKKLLSLKEAGLTSVNVSLDTLVDKKFVEITRRKGLNKVLANIDAACDVLGSENVKINVVVMKGFNDDELASFVRLTKDRDINVRFIEWMPFSDNGWSADRFLPYSSMIDSIASDSVNLQSITSEDVSDTTKWWKGRESETGEEFLGRVGFITSMSSHFCSTCNRIRLTADGNLKVCLFNGGEVSLRDILRADEFSISDLRKIVGTVVREKKEFLGGHGDMNGIKRDGKNRPMTLIGG